MPKNSGLSVHRKILMPNEAIGVSGENSSQIRVRSVSWIRKHYHCTAAVARKVRLHIMLHEIGHIACKHYDQKNNYDVCFHPEPNAIMEAEATIYACKCLKNPMEILGTLAITQKAHETFMVEDWLEENGYDIDSTGAFFL